MNCNKINCKKGKSFHTGISDKNNEIAFVACKKSKDNNLFIFLMMFTLNLLVYIHIKIFMFYKPSD
jgi:hypothetical protein